MPPSRQIIQGEVIPLELYPRRITLYLTNFQQLTAFSSDSIFHTLTSLQIELAKPPRVLKHSQ
jgi:hypothetical protein